MDNDAAPSGWVEMKQIRDCDGCTLCCKLMRIDELKKPQGKWCSHCRPGTGCTIYETRPEECQRFLCGYLLDPRLSEEWKPSRSKLVVTSEVISNRITIHADPGRTGSWRTEPYYSQMKQWAVNAAYARGQVIVMLGRRAIMLLPDRDVDLGVIGDDELIVTGERSTSEGRVIDAYVVKKTDPAGQQIEAAEGGAVHVNLSDSNRFRKGKTI